MLKNCLLHNLPAKRFHGRQFVCLKKSGLEDLHGIELQLAAADSPQQIELQHTSSRQHSKMVSPGVSQPPGSPHILLL